MNRYFIYIMSSKNRSFQIGMTEDIKSTLKSVKVDEEKKLVFYEIYENKSEAEERLRDMGGWFKRKTALVIDLVNPEWADWGKEFLEDDMQQNMIYS